MDKAHLAPNEFVRWVGKKRGGTFGIRAIGRVYSSTQLGNYVGKKVLIRLHSRDLATIFTTDGKLICTAETEVSHDQ